MYPWWHGRIKVGSRKNYQWVGHEIIGDLPKSDTQEHNGDAVRIACLTCPKGASRMADVSQTRGDLAGHPDATEMRERYARMLGGRDVTFVDGPVFLIGLYCAISPWVVHFSVNQPSLAVHNLIVGIAIGLMALGFTMVPERMYGLSWAMCAIGVWVVLSSWIVGTSPDAGVVWNNLIIGALAFAMGLACAMTARRVSRES
jgi:hypothetical protein